MESIKLFINYISAPQIMFTMILGVFFFIFPATDGLYRLNKRLSIHKLWTNKGRIFIFSGMNIFFIFGLTNENFRLTPWIIRNFLFLKKQICHYLKKNLKQYINFFLMIILDVPNVILLAQKCRRISIQVVLNFQGLMIFLMGMNITHKPPLNTTIS